MLVIILISGCIGENNLNSQIESKSEKGSISTESITDKKSEENGKTGPYFPVVTPAVSPNSIGMEFIQIPAGEFDMGSPPNEKGRKENEGPIHRVKIEKAFYMGKYEVTQKQWLEVMGSNPSYFKGDNLPVESVSWKDVQEFIKKLNEKEGTNNYRLPSEAEWEYATRAGTTTRYFFGNDESKIGDYAWYDSSETHEVGQKKPNPWGLYDMIGNVGEWVQDVYHDYNDAPTDSNVWEGNGSLRCIRGPGKGFYSGFLRSARRDSNFPDARWDNFLGFRLATITTVIPIATPTPTISISYESTPIQTEVVKIDDKIEIDYKFGCVRYCSSDSGPSESDNIFYIQNVGTSTLHNFKVVIDFHRASGDYYSTKSSTVIQDIESNTESSVLIKVPFQYVGTETWTYAKLYILEDGTQYYLTDWKSKNSAMPPINGTFVTIKKQ